MCRNDERGAYCQSPMMLALLETITDLFVCDQTGGDVLILEGNSKIMIVCFGCATSLLTFCLFIHSEAAYCDGKNMPCIVWLPAHKTY